MSSEEANSSEVSSLSPTVQELDENLGRRLSRLVSRIIRNSSDSHHPPQDSDRHGRIRVIMFNSSTGNMIVIEGPSDLDSIFQELTGKSGVSPATKDSIESLPRVVVTEEDKLCSICLEDYEIGDEAREMPCKHRFHSPCVEKWLKIHGTCPLCRFSMPMEEVENKTSRTTEEDGDEGLEIDEIAEGIIPVNVWVRTLRGNSMDLDRELAPNSGDTNSDSQHENSGSGAHEDSSMIQDMELQHENSAPGAHEDSSMIQDMELQHENSAPGAHEDSSMIQDMEF